MSFQASKTNTFNIQMYMIASRIITMYTGSYTSFVKERIFAPLNMTSTTFSPNEAAKSGKLTQSWIQEGRRIPQYITEETAEIHAGPGGIITSALDMVTIVYLPMTLSMMSWHRSNGLEHCWTLV